ncbi:MAG TPA: isoprenylcysteine carboxylmethyltransferase family protein [Terriglobia bacterium]|nr:isoprenylcysteine carboxylmethyltransferase family protein [Terriglobia bacterium]
MHESQKAAGLARSSHRSESPQKAANQAAGMQGVVTEWFLRVFAIFIYCVAVFNIARALWVDPTRWTLLALLVTEGYAMVLIVCARRSTLRDTSIVAVVATLYSVFYYVLFDPGKTTPLISEFTGVIFYIVGTAWQFYAKTALGRSFGLLPAQRGFVGSGPYRFVRHPMYLGYLIGQTGFVLANFSWLNMLVLVGIYLALGLRISREEAVLETSDDYREYRKHVHWRVFPYIF